MSARTRLPQEADAADPAEVRWDRVELPDAWPDRVSPRHPAASLRMLRTFATGRGGPIELPPDLPGREAIPRYVLQEFHNLPNGNYSRSMASGYARGFDRAMLGRLRPLRVRIGEALRDCDAVLDVGCGAGHLAAAIHREGVPEVWGIDPSPYLLKIAQRRCPDLHLVQGVGERCGFRAERFDGIGVCFVLHELPQGIADRVLAECHRLLRPGGRLCLVEPGADQWELSVPRLVGQHGWRGLYFWLLAHFAFEPFLATFHRRDVTSWLATHGFEVLDTHDHFPARYWHAQRR